MSPPTGMRLALVAILGIVAVQALMVFAFSWPATNSGPRDVPVAVAGPPEAAAAIEQGMSAVPSPDDGTPAFDVTVVPDAPAAEQAIADREVYGAVVVGPDGPSLLVASSASPAIAQLLRSAAAELTPDAAGVPVVDVAPTPSGDPSGGGLATGVLPLVMTSAAAGLVAAVLLARRSERFVMVGGLAVAAGLASAALLQFGLGVVDGPYWSLAGVLALLVGAIVAAVAGLGAVLGRAGVGLGMLLMIFFANPLSAAATGPYMLPQPWGDVGQLMPPGAGMTAVRSVEFFDGAGAGTPIIVLLAWLVAGLLLVLVAPNRGGGGQAEADTVADRDTNEAGSQARA